MCINYDETMTQEVLENEMLLFKCRGRNSS